MERAAGIFAVLLTIFASSGSSFAQGTEAREFQRYLDGWFEKHKPAWYDFVRVSNKYQEASADLRYAQRAVFARRMMEEARKPDPPVAYRRHSFCRAVGTLVATLSPSTEQVVNWSRSVGESDLFTSDNVQIVVQQAWGAHRSAEVVRTIRSFPATRAADRGRLPWTIDYDPPQCLVSPATQLAELINRPMRGGAGTLIMSVALRRLMQRGEFEQVERFIRGVDLMRTDEFSRGSLRYFRVSWLQELRTARAGRELQLKMQKAVRDQFGPDIDRLSAPTPTFDNIRRRDSFSLTRRFLHHLAAVRDSLYTTKNLNQWHAQATNYVANDMDDWRTLAADLHALFPSHRSTRQAINEVVAAGIKGGRSDEEIAEWLRVLPRCYDVHEASQRKFVEGLLAPWRRTNIYPKARGEVGLLDVFLTVRSGQDLAPGAWSGWEHEDKAAHKLKHELRASLRNNIRADLARLLDESPPDLMVQGVVLPYSILAGERLERKTQAERLRETARARIHAMTLNAWAGPSIATGLSAIELASVVETDSQQALRLFPAGFIDHVRGHPDGTSRNRFLAHAALLREDWATAFRLFEKALGETPNDWRYFYWRGLAAARLGRAQEATRDLEIFVGKCPDEPTYSDAVELLRRIR